jgi:hypothetical protein
LPGYTLELEQLDGKREPSVRMRRRPAEPQSGAARSMAPARSTSVHPTKSDGAATLTLDAPTGEAEPLFDARDVIRRTLTGLSTKASAGELTDATLATLRAECPGWDYQSLHQDFRNWLDADPTRTPVNYQKAFIGFVRRFHEKNRHRL